MEMKVKDIATNFEDKKLLTSYLKVFQTYRGGSLHNGDEIITSEEAENLINLNRSDRQVNWKDWQEAANVSLIPQENFGRVVKLLAPLLNSKINISNFRHFNTLFSSPNFLSSDSPFWPAARTPLQPCDSCTEKFERLDKTSTAELHYHYGPAIPIPDLYQMALNCVGDEALLSVQECGRKMDWSKDKIYTQLINGVKMGSQSIDDLIRMTFPSSKNLPSQVVAAGQKIARKLKKKGITQKEKSRLLLERDSNLAQFKNITTYTPTANPSEKSFNRFRNIYKIYSSLIETAPPKQQQEAIAASIRQLSKENVLYAEMHLNAPKEEEVMKGKKSIYGPQEAMNEAVEKYFVSYIQAILETNRELIRKGENPVDLRLIYLLSKNRSTDSQQNFYQANAIIHFLQNHPIYSNYIVGIDGASQELGEPPSLYEDVLKPIHEFNSSNPIKKLGITWHEGEIFEDVFGSIRWVDEAIERLKINRLGHGLSLAIDPKLLLGKKFEIPISEYIAQLNYDKKNSLKNPIFPYVQNHAKNLDDELKRANSLLTSNPKAKVSIQYPSSEKIKEVAGFLSAVEERQVFVLNNLNRKKIVIEANPTSNLYMTPYILNIKDYPLKTFIERGAKLTISTDDPSIFDITSKGELLNVAQLGLTQTQFNNIIQTGFDASFAVTIRNESLDLLRY